MKTAVLIQLKPATLMALTKEDKILAKLFRKRLKELGYLLA